MAALSLAFGQFLRRDAASSSLRLLDADYFSNEEENLNSILTEQTQDLCTTAQVRDHIAAHNADSVLCILHVSRSLLNATTTHEQMVQDVVPVNCECALDLLMFGEENNIADMSLAAWSLIFDTFPVETWIQVLRILCLFTELIPEKQRQALLWDQSVEVKSVMEELPWNRYCALATLIQVLQRDVRNRKQVAALFGSWILLDSRARTVRANVERAGQVMLALLTDQHVAQQQRAFSWESTMTSLFRSTNQSLRNLIPMKKEHGSSDSGSHTSSRKMLEDAQNRPARHRDSIERIYGVTPSPPPKSKLSSCSNTSSPPPAKSSKLSTKSSSSSDSELVTGATGGEETVARTPPKFATAAPLSTTTSPYARTSYNRHQTSGLGVRSNSNMLVAPPPLPNVANKPAFVLKPAVVAAAASTPRPVNHSRMPPPRPMAAVSPGNTYAAALQAARRRGTSKETI